MVKKLLSIIFLLTFSTALLAQDDDAKDLEILENALIGSTKLWPHPIRLVLPQGSDSKQTKRLKSIFLSKTYWEIPSLLKNGKLKKAITPSLSLEMNLNLVFIFTH